MINKITIAIFLSFTLFSFSGVYALPLKKPDRAPNQIESSSIKFTIVYGEKTTNFILTNNPSGKLIEHSNSFGAHSTKKISDADFDYIKSKLESIAGPTNKKDFCPRNYVEITNGSFELTGCLGALNKVSGQIQELVNLISLLF